MKKDMREIIPVTVRGVAIGQGMPKICVPVGGAHPEEILDEVSLVTASNADIVEWRADFLERPEVETVLGILPSLREEVGEMPLMFTCRSAGEGGKGALDGEEYERLVSAVFLSGQVDMIDVELSAGEERVRRLAAAARGAGVRVVVSRHDVLCTPACEEVIALFRCMREWGADVPKLAVMPQSFNDILNLLSATNAFIRETRCPLIAMSLSSMGAVTRLLGEVCGSAVTFGSMRRMSVEDGPLAVDDLRIIYNILQSGGEGR